MPKHKLKLVTWTLSFPIQRKIFFKTENIILCHILELPTNG